MSPRQRQRLLAVGGLLGGLTLAAALGFTALRENLMYFYTPTDLVADDAPVGARVRLGGLVETGSVVRGDGLSVQFTLADCTQSLPVRYEGILPDLFREGQGIVASGRLDENRVFVADEVLAKHDENYMPPELAATLKTPSGHSCEPFKALMKQAAAAP
ncbi:MAG: cytochrome c maturation protein CcmE [Gammaproteobacteria bacterium]